MDDIRVKLASLAPSAEVFTKRFGGFVSACAEDAFSSKFDNSYIRALIEQPERCVNLHSSSAFRLTNIIYPPRIFQIFSHEITSCRHDRPSRYTPSLSHHCSVGTRKPSHSHPRFTKPRKSPQNTQRRFEFLVILVPTLLQR